MSNLPVIPAKRYFTISEVALLCDVKPHVLRYWEQEFVQLRPMKRRGNRRYYQHHELLMVRRIRALLYEEGFTIQGARNQLRTQAGGAGPEVEASPAPEVWEGRGEVLAGVLGRSPEGAAVGAAAPAPAPSWGQVRGELLEIRSLLAL